MTQHAIFETGGKQYRVKEGDEIFIETLDADGGKVKFDKVLAFFGAKGSEIGTPYVKDAAVSASILKTGKAKKIIVYKMHPKKRYRRKQGHRQPYMKIKIDKITHKAAKSEQE